MNHELKLLKLFTETLRISQGHSSLLLYGKEQLGHFVILMTSFLSPDKKEHHTEFDILKITKLSPNVY